MVRRTHTNAGYCIAIFEINRIFVVFYHIKVYLVADKLGGQYL